MAATSFASVLEGSRNFATLMRHRLKNVHDNYYHVVIKWASQRFNALMVLFEDCVNSELADSVLYTN